MKLPPGRYLAWQLENLALARERLPVVVPGVFILVYLLLSGVLGSAGDALLVFRAVPLALTGGVGRCGFAACRSRSRPSSASSALSGEAVLNGLVMLTQTRKLIADGVHPDGALTRFRPVAMTALVASLGFVPIATGTGAEVREPLATIVIGGLLTATLLTLVVLPALYARFAVPVSTTRHSSRKLRIRRVGASRLTAPVNLLVSQIFGLGLPQHRSLSSFPREPSK